MVRATAYGEHALGSRIYGGKTIRRIDWNAARNDVQRFLPLREQEGLRAWNTDFFLNRLTYL